MDIIIIGFALFAMFFGAGNLIFPPFIGNMYGSNWLIAGIGFVLIGVGLTALAVISMAKKRGNIMDFTGAAGKKLGLVATLLICLCVGPLGGIPRVGATSAEITIAAGINIPYWIFVVVFFSLSCYFALSGSKVIDIIGKYLTPALLLVLLIMIISGIINPIGPIEVSEYSPGQVFADSAVEGYNTMDAIAALAFTPIIIKSVIDKGHEDTLVKTTVKSSAVAVIGLAIVYLALSYLGAITSVVHNNIESRVNLLIYIASEVLGIYGKYILSAIIILACFTTSIGLISSIADIFDAMSNHKFSYKQFVIGITVISLAISLMGVDSIVKFVFPFLSFVYPLVILMIVYNLLPKLPSVRVRKITFTVVGVVSLIQGLSELIGAVNEAAGKSVARIIGWIPLSDSGFPWLVPFILALIIALVFLDKNESINAIKKEIKLFRA